MIVQAALNGLSRRWQAIPPDVRRTHWPASVLCLVSGAAWGYIMLRIDEVVLWQRDSVHALDTWARARSHGVVFDTIATVIVVAIGLELAQRLVRILAWHARERQQAESPVPFPERNLRFTAFYVGFALFVIMLWSPLLEMDERDFPGTAFYSLEAVFFIIAGPFEVFHGVARYVAWDERKRAACA